MAALLVLVRAAVSAEVPARADCRIKPIGAGGAEVGNADIMVVLSEPVHLVLHHANFEIFGKLKPEADRSLEGDTGHGRGVFELRHIVAERKSGREKEEEMARQGFSERLNFQIAAQQVARVGIAVGVRPSGRDDYGG